MIFVSLRAEFTANGKKVPQLVNVMSVIDPRQMMLSTRYLDRLIAFRLSLYLDRCFLLIPDCFRKPIIVLGSELNPILRHCRSPLASSAAPCRHR